VSTAPKEAAPVERVDRLDASEVRAVLALAGAAGDADGADPLSEHVVLQLRHGGDPRAPHLTIREPDGVLVGYAHVEVGEAEQAEAELVVHPMHRRRGHGRALVTGVAQAATGPLQVWAHGDHPSAAALALDLGFERVRELWQMRRPLVPPLPESRLPAGVSLRAFRPGEDEEAWLTVNQRAFADHPEQGRWTLDDLRVRMSEPWFDPAGFLLAVEESTGRLLGFHWTKVHGQEHGPNVAGRSISHVPDPIGEVYVLGVDPLGKRPGLGRALTAAGLHHLRDRGQVNVMLYVDMSNSRAVGLYTQLGFQRWSTHVRYRRQ
jgi:mycothiol synthase